MIMHEIMMTTRKTPEFAKLVTENIHLREIIVEGLHLYPQTDCLPVEDMYLLTLQMKTLVYILVKNG